MSGSSKRASLLLASLLLLATLALSSPQYVRAEPGADIAASITGPKNIRIGDYITYTITGTNVGDAAATGVELSGWAPDWFDGGSVSCLGGVLSEYGTCTYPWNPDGLAPGDSVGMNITLKAVAGNKAERHMYELGWAAAANDVNPTNDEASIDVNMIGVCRDCPNK
jgi:hypothetical protein